MCHVQKSPVGTLCKFWQLPLPKMSYKGKYIAQAYQFILKGKIWARAARIIGTILVDTRKIVGKISSPAMRSHGMLRHDVPGVHAIWVSFRRFQMSIIMYRPPLLQLCTGCP